jgi:NDP-hexose C3-ketoreductase / dTDP-4-oxo-2-deoxy-alpha-D-pentos-2-ene 2,3-reductase
MRSPSRSAPLRTPPTVGRKPGEAETIIGNWFATGGGRRERTFIATKVYGEMGAEPGSWLSAWLLTRPAVSARSSVRELVTSWTALRLPWS